MYYGDTLKNKNPKEGDLQVWHIPQVPGKAFKIAVKTPQEAKRIFDILAYYDFFQLENNIKPDFSNAQGLVIFKDGEWVTWHDENDFDIDELELDEEGNLVQPY